MYKELRTLRAKITEIETVLGALSLETGSSLADIIDEFDDVLKEDCGQYSDGHFITIHRV